MVWWKELIGYMAPVFIILSMTRSSVEAIRFWMVLGCVTFVIYGWLVAALPVVIANALIAVVTLYCWLRDRKKALSE